MARSFVFATSILILSQYSYGQLLPNPFLSERDPCTLFTDGRALFFDGSGSFTAANTWLYTHKDECTLPCASPIINMDPTSGTCPTPFSLSPPKLIGSLDLDLSSSPIRLWAGELESTSSVFYYKATPTPSWTTAFSTTGLFTNFIIQEELIDRGKINALTFDSSDGTLWLGNEKSCSLYHVTQSGSPVSGEHRLLLPFPRGGVEAAGDFLFISSLFENRIYLYSKSGRYPLGNFYSINPAETSPFSSGRYCEDLDIRTVTGSPTQTVLSAHTAVNSDIASINVIIEFNVTNMVADPDADGIPTVVDNCPSTSNPNQQDSNNDGIGDACQSGDADGDGVASNVDNCPSAYNPNQADGDTDGIGDVCDPVSSFIQSEQLAYLPNHVADAVFADLDGDGDDDLVTIHDKLLPQIGAGDVGIVSIRWAGSHGSIGSLSDSIEYATGENPIAVAVGDFNNDTYKDIAVMHAADVGASTINPGITVLFGDANRHFGVLKHFDIFTSGTSFDMFATDLNGATGDDLVLISSEPKLITITDVGAANPTIAVSSALTFTPSSPVKTIAADLNADGRLDIIAQTNTTSLLVYLGQSGTPYFNLTTPGTYSIPSAATDIEAVKILSSAAFDIVAQLSGANADKVAILPNSGSGTFGSAVTQTIGNGGKLLNIARLANSQCPNCSSGLDGLIAFYNESSSVSTRPRRLSFLPPSGSGNFNVSARNDVIVSPSNLALLAVGNMDKNSNGDAVVVDFNSGSTPQAFGPFPQDLSLVRNVSQATGVGAFSRITVQDPQMLAIGDFDGQNGPDIAVANYKDDVNDDAGNVEVFLQSPTQINRFPLTSNERYCPGDITNPCPTSSEVFCVAAGKLNGDNLADFLVGYRSLVDGKPYLRPYLRSGSAFTPQTLIAVASSITNPTELKLADLDNDGDLDAVVLLSGTASASNLLVLAGNGAGSFGTPIEIGAPGIYGQFSAVIRDLDCDGRPEIITADVDNDQVSIFRNISAVANNPTFDAPVIINMPSTAGEPRSVACGLFPGAKGQFIAVADDILNKVFVYHKTTASSLTYALSSSYDITFGLLSPRPYYIASGDLDNDGDDDLCTINRTTAALSLLWNDGAGGFSAISTLPTGATGTYVACADINADGVADIISCGGTGSNSFLRINASAGNGSHDLGCLKGDVNQDGLINGKDIQLFTRSLLNPGSATAYQRCASDINNNTLVNMQDIPLFVCLLLGNPVCTGCTMGSAGGFLLIDCNNNGVQDSEDISAIRSADCNANEIPDECESDCNNNDVPDDCDIANSTSPDCNANGRPDECEQDCNHNSVPDDCDISSLTSQDCNGNAYPDECDLALPPGFGSLDCNDNEIPDECDIASEHSFDENENGIPDECEEQQFGGNSMMQGGGESEGGGSESECAGLSEEECWGLFWEWAIQECWGVGCELSGTEQYQLLLDKLDELGLSIEALPH